LLKDDPRSDDEIFSFLPKACQDAGLYSLGVLGYGNHFIELQAIERITNNDIAERFGIKEGQLCLMLHSDSRAFGQSLFDFYSGKAKKLLGAQQAYKRMHYRIISSTGTPLFVKNSLEALNRSLNRIKSTFYWKFDRFSGKKKADFPVLEAGSPEADAYLTSTYCALNFGYANRAYLVSVIRDAFRKVFGKEEAGLRILFDGNHDSLQKERIDSSDYYVHRNGANRALPPVYFPRHPVFSSTGQPVLLPSALGRHSFLCAATKGCAASYYSTCHGTGRLVDRGEARKIYDNKAVFDEVKRAGMKVYDYGNGHTAEEAPSAFKDADRVLNVLIKNDIAEPVARIRPLAALKGWR